MAFANLFAGLVVNEEVKSPGQRTFKHRNESNNGKRGNARKRKTEGEQNGPDKKKQRYQAQTGRTDDTKSIKDGDSKAIHYHMQNTGSEHASIGFAREVIHNEHKFVHNNMYHKSHNYKGKSSRNVKKQQQQEKKTERQKSQAQRKDGGRHTNRGGRHQTRPTSRKGGGNGKHKDGKQNVQVKPTRSMTQEFKDQNALLVDGQLLCRHFLWGRCIKGDNCQLEHIQGYNDLIKEVCKFYIQGLCTKGEGCPYMHKSFPCKFFHRKGKCSQRADCKFSHEPLNETTNRLLDEALKRENELYELAKKAKQESSGQPENTDESKITEANRTPDILMQPLRPNFYNSGEKNAKQEVLLCQTEPLSDIMETAAPPQASDGAQPHSLLSTNLNQEEPVCYSVEAVLGPKLFKPFPGFFKSPESQESAPLYVPQTTSDCTSGSAHQSKVQYSVDATDTVSSCKSVGNSTFGHIPTSPTVQTVTYTPKNECGELTDPLLSETENVLYSPNTRNEANKSQEKMFSSLSSFQVHTDLISKTCPDLTLASWDHKKQGGEMLASLKPAQRASYEVKLEVLHSAATVAEKSLSSKRKGDQKGSTCLPMDILNCKSESVLPFAPTKHRSLTFTPKCPIQLNPHLSGLTSNSQASVKPLCPSSSFSEFKGRAPVPAELVTSSARTWKLGKQQHYSNESTAECSKMAQCGDLLVGCKKTQKRPLYSLFESPITDSLKPTPDFLTTPYCPQGFIQSSCPIAQSAHCRSKNIHVKTAVEPDQASARSFLSLFAAPLTTPPLQCVQSKVDYSTTASCSQESNQSADNKSQLSDSKQRALNLETPLSRQVKTGVKQTSHRPTSPEFSPIPKNENEEDLSEPVNQPTKQQGNPVCSLVSDSLSEMSSSPTPCGGSADPSVTQAHEQLPNISSPKESAGAATADSVLKTLFLCLSPYQQDREQQDSFQISVPSESGKQDKSSTGCVFVKQRQKRKKSRRRNKLKTQYSQQQSTEKTFAHSTERQPSFQASLISLDATIESTLSSPAITEHQVKNSRTHNLPFKPVTQLMQRHTRPRLKNTSEERGCVNGNVAVAPLKDLFKTLDTNVFHFER
ncbi:uncharacterized protein LOC120800191 [Xiphias gladius]|uniref:uncharacterized protein LOC120800191 n=1 Tax=Xiphias gladius TaxID=8245 RepID=UPI001A991806|nr:uncharacterized protein LOC120800191 [Xiphias gladius]XP_040002028.1 uncharacterized protein LOC120800191 [Xiphias gladius]